jgi:hypothetical protein
MLDRRAAAKPQTRRSTGWSHPLTPIGRIAILDARQPGLVLATMARPRRFRTATATAATRIRRKPMTALPAPPVLSRSVVAKDALATPDGGPTLSWFGTATGGWLAAAVSGIGVVENLVLVAPPDHGQSTVNPKARPSNSSGRPYHVPKTGLRERSAACILRAVLDGGDAV